VRGQAGGEVQRVRGAGGAAIAELQPPQVRDGDRLAVGVFQLADETAAVRIEGVDVAIAEIADQQIVAERAKVRGGDRYCPWIIELAVDDQAPLQLAVGVLDVDGAVAQICRPVEDLIDRGVFDVEPIIDGLDVERMVVVRQFEVDGQEKGDIINIDAQAGSALLWSDAKNCQSVRRRGVVSRRQPW
jgi:hypothetical protein